VIGETISRYRIQAKIGEGASGEVYLAEHLQLHHPVAIKILKGTLVHGEEARQRFRHEAQAAADLDSPGLCNVIDVGEHDGRTYLVMRYCEGPDLKQLLQRGPLPVDQAVLLAIQLAEALATAHARGIVHRDLKPGNIMVGCPSLDSAAPAHDASTVLLGRGPPAGSMRVQARIVDFGLALLPDASRLTVDGGLVGTPAYMAPEQVAGEAVDRRADLWALGAILYEMVSGHPAFTGDSPAGVLAAVVRSHPPSLSSVCPGAPAKLIWIVAKALRKRLEDRYQDADEMLRDLRSLHTDLRVGTATCRPTWVVENLRWLRWLSAALVATAALGAGLWLAGLVGGRGDGVPLVTPRALTVGDGWEGEPDVSPAGDRVAYASNAAGQFDLHVVSIGGGQPLRITQHPGRDRAPAWFPDGDQLAFVSDRLGVDGIWTVHQYGGDATLLLADATDPAISPDGRWLAFARLDSTCVGRIGVASVADPTDARLLTRGHEHGLWDHREPAWSHDGTLICYSAKNNLWLLAPLTGHIRQLTRDGREDRVPCWSPDDRHVYFQSQRGEVQGLWRVRVRDGSTEPVTRGGGVEFHPTVARDGRRLAFHAVDARRNDLLIIDLATGREAHVRGESGGDFPSLSPDGTRLAFVSDRWSGRAEVWIQDLADGQPRGDPRRITEQPGNASHPSLSADGTLVAYYRFEGAVRDLWMVPADGGRPTQLTFHRATDAQPTWSPDGRWLAFTSDREGAFAVWLLPMQDGRRAGDPVRLTPPGMVGERPVWSPDGERIAFHTGGEVWIMDAEPGAVPRQLTTGALAARLRWDASSDAIWVSGYWGEGVYNLRKVPLAGGDPQPVLAGHPDGKSDDTQLFDLSGDGRILALSRRSSLARVWLLEATEGSF